MDKTKEFVVDPIIEATKKNKKKLVIALIVTAVLLLIAALTVVFAATKTEPKERYTLEEKNVTFTYKTQGTILSTDEKQYDMEKGDNIEYMLEFTGSVDDKVKKDDELFSYTKTTIGTDTITKIIKTTKDAIVLGIEDGDVALRTGMSLTGSYYNIYTPTVGQCVVYYDNEIYGAAEVSSAEAGYNEYNVLTKPIGFDESKQVGIAFVPMDLSDMYECEGFGYNFQTGKIFNDQGERLPAHQVSTLLNVTTEVMEAEDIEGKVKVIEDANYIGISTAAIVEVGDEVVAEDGIFSESFHPYAIEDFIFATPYDGYVSEVTDNYIKIINTEANHLDFDINKEYLDKIAVNQDAIISMGDILISDTIDVILINEEGNDDKAATATIENPNFKTYNGEDAIEVTIEANEINLLLIPKKYIVSNKVMKISGEEAIEVQVEYEEYNAENYLITAGLIAGDVVEEF